MLLPTCSLMHTHACFNDLKYLYAVAINIFNAFPSFFFAFLKIFQLKQRTCMYVYSIFHVDCLSWLWNIPSLCLVFIARTKITENIWCGIQRTENKENVKETYLSKKREVIARLFYKKDQNLTKVCTVC